MAAKEFLVAGCVGVYSEEYGFRVKLDGLKAVLRIGNPLGLNNRSLCCWRQGHIYCPPSRISTMREKLSAW